MIFADNHMMPRWYSEITTFRMIFRDNHLAKWYLEITTFWMIFRGNHPVKWYSEMIFWWSLHLAIRWFFPLQNMILTVPLPCNTVIFSCKVILTVPPPCNMVIFFLQGYSDGPSTLQYGDNFPARLFWWSLYLVERIPPSCIINTRALGERVGTVFFFFFFF